MTQRIFDVDNPQDVKDLFELVPDDFVKLYKTQAGACFERKSVYCVGFDKFTVIFKINWRDKTEITRPVDESKWIGCLCWFADDAGDEYIGVLHAICNGDDSYPYVCKNKLLRAFKDCRPVRRDEVLFVEDEK